jgi:Integrase core domain
MGKDERFHRSLKAEALCGVPFAGLEAAARRLAEWRDVYNAKRPHEGIGMAVPTARYAQSPRNYKERIEAFDYAQGDVVRRAQAGGKITLGGRTARVPKCLRGRDIALRPAERDGVYDLYYRHQYIAKLDFARAPRDA